MLLSVTCDSHGDVLECKMEFFVVWWELFVVFVASASADVVYCLLLS